MKDNFYERLDFYRMLSAGMTSMEEMAVVLGISVRTLWRWKETYDPEKGPYGSITDISVSERLGLKHETGDVSDSQVDLSVRYDVGMKRGSRKEILWAIRHAALEGNMQAAKLLLAEYEENPPEGEDLLTVDRAIELLGEWSEASDRPPSGCGLPP